MPADEQQSQGHSGVENAAQPVAEGRSAAQASSARKATVPTLPPVDYLKPRQSPVLEIAFRRDESSETASPRRQLIGFVAGLLAALVVGLSLYVVL